MDKSLDVQAIWNEHKATILMLACVFLYTGITVASTNGASTTNDASFSNAYYYLDSIVKGKLGLLLASISFIIGLIWGVAKQSFMIVVGSFVIALLIAFGLDAVTGVVNSSLLF